jgi:hypothetical protein
MDQIKHKPTAECKQEHFRNLLSTVLHKQNVYHVTYTTFIYYRNLFQQTY